MKLLAFAFAAALIASATIVKSALADTVYSQPSAAPDFNPNGGTLGFQSNTDFSGLPYDNFTLSSSATVNDVVWYGLAFGGQPSSFTVSFYSDGGDQPGTLFYTETAAATPLADGNSYSGAPEYVYSVSILPQVFGVGTQYWLGVEGNAPNWIWVLGTGGDSKGYESGGGGEIIPFDFAFSLTGSVAPTPEPASFIMLGTGLLGVSGAVRRKFMRA